MVSSVSSVSTQPRCPWIMKPSLSCADDFNFLLIVTSYLIHLLLFLFSKVTYCSEPFFFVTANMKHLSELPSSDKLSKPICLPKLDKYLKHWSRVHRLEIFSVCDVWQLYDDIWRSLPGKFMMTEIISLIWFFVLVYLTCAEVAHNILEHVGSVLYTKQGIGHNTTWIWT